jgi:hypothetical protein
MSRAEKRLLTEALIVHACLVLWGQTAQFKSFHRAAIAVLKESYKKARPR